MCWELTVTSGLRWFQKGIFVLDIQSDRLQKLLPHEPCWLILGVSRCGLDHVTVPALPRTPVKALAVTVTLAVFLNAMYTTRTEA
jgi:hypothetical protein